jgi:hypothetical protein
MRTKTDDCVPVRFLSRAKPLTLMKKARIHLSQPFEHVLATVLSLPRTREHAVGSSRQGTVELRHLLRQLYEAANGRQVETTIGLVPIAPPVAAHLNETPFEVESQLDFLLEAMSRMIARPSQREGLDATSATVEQRNGKAETDSVERRAEERRSRLSFLSPSLFPHRYSSISR